MTDEETERTGELCLTLAGKHSVVVVEHDMDFVAGIARKVTVLHEGSVLAEGSMEEVQNDAARDRSLPRAISMRRSHESSQLCHSEADSRGICFLSARRKADSSRSLSPHGHSE